MRPNGNGGGILYLAHRGVQWKTRSSDPLEASGRTSYQLDSTSSFLSLVVRPGAPFVACLLQDILHHLEAQRHEAQWVSLCAEFRQSSTPANGT